MKRTSIGGQALMEGIMMRNGNQYAMTVRKPDQSIETKVEKTKSIGDDYPILKAPFIRGVVNFAESLVVGMKSLNYSASFFEEEEEEIEEKEKNSKKEIKEKKEKQAEIKTEEKKEKQAEIMAEEKKEKQTEVKKEEKKEKQDELKTEEKVEKQSETKTDEESSKETDAEKNADLASETKKNKGTKTITEEEKEKAKENAFMLATIVISLVISISLFMIAPYLIASLFESVIDSMLVMSLLEGLIKILIFLGYIVLISNIKDIKRTYMYHGAEHKTINCLEAGEDLTVENIKKHSRIHKRCGTSFLLFVILISILLFMFIIVETVALRIIVRLLLVPVIAGISYELIRLAGKSDSKIIGFLSKPGMAMQKLTTKEPDDDMIEVAIASVEAVFDWKPYVEAIRKGEIED